MRSVNIIDDDDDNNYHYIPDDGLYPKEISTPRTPGTPRTPTFPSLILGLLPGSSNQGKGLKILLPNQLLQRLLIVLAQVQAGNTRDMLGKTVIPVGQSNFQRTAAIIY